MSLESSDALSEEELTSAVAMLQQLLPQEELNRLQPSGPATVYTTMVTLWMLVLQRLGGGKSLKAIVKEVLAYNRSLLPDNKRLREGTLSENSGAYSEARQRIRLETIEYFAERVCDSLIQASPSWFDGKRAFLMDGTTITLPPEPALKAAFPPATNQHGESVWPLAQLLVVHELQSGCALPPEIGAKFGENNVSETQLAQRVLPRLPQGSIVLADSGFGIFSVAHATRSAGHDFLFRLSRSRFKSLRRRATVVEQTDTTVCYRLDWTPSDKDRKTNPDLPSDAVIPVLLHDVPLGKGNEERLYLVGTLDILSYTAGHYYLRRYDVEHDIRDVKVTLNTERIRARSVEMVRKELLTSTVAYNLVIQFRRQAAELAKLPPRRLSFTGVWNTFESFLLHQPPCAFQEWQRRYANALRIASRDKLPQRPGRSYPRKAHPRRQKSTNEQRIKSKKSKSARASGIPEKPK